MAARINITWHPDEVRKRIKGSQLINRLQDNAFAENEFLTQGQVRCIELLLRKCMPDLATVTVKGDGDEPVKMVIEWASKG